MRWRLQRADRWSQRVRRLSLSSLFPALAVFLKGEGEGERGLRTEAVFLEYRRDARVALDVEGEGDAGGDGDNLAVA